MKALIVGGTGLLGMEVCSRLAALNQPTRALIRTTSDPAKRTALQRLRVELVEGDLKDAASLARACAGVDAVVSTASSTLSRQAGDSIASVDRDGQLALVAAARQAGVSRFVYVSFPESPDAQYPLVVAKRAVEHALRASGMIHTILQPSNFMEVWLSPALGFDIAARRVRLCGDGSRPISWISYRDVGRVVASALVDGIGANMTLPLAGPHMISPREVVRMAEQAGAGPIAIETVPESMLEAQLRTASDPLEQSFAGLMLRTARGDAFDGGLSNRLFPFPRTSVQEFIAAQLAAN